MSANEQHRFKAFYKYEDITVHDWAAGIVKGPN
jgi:hypothetical protein